VPLNVGFIEVPDKHLVEIPRQLAAGGVEHQMVKRDLAGSDLR
jgi:hypothetical protein